MGQGQGPFQPVLAPPYLESSCRQILITWQSHPRRLRGSSHFQGQHPKQLCSCLTGQVSHLELKNKPQILQQTFLKPHELCPAPSRPWQSCRLWEEWEMTVSSMPLVPLSPFSTPDHSTPSCSSFLPYLGWFFHLHKGAKFQLQRNICYNDVDQVSYATDSRLPSFLPLHNGLSPALLLVRAVSGLKLLAWLKALEKCSSTTEPMSPWK